jgi:hypothetical protein
VKTLALSVALVIAIAVGGFFLVRSLLIGEHLVGSVFETDLPRAIAVLALAAVTYVHQALSGRGRRPSFTALPDRAVGFSEYTLPWQTMVVYGVLMVYAASGLGTLLIWMIGESTGLFLSRWTSLLNNVAVMAALFLVGSWLGARCNRLPHLAALLVVALYQAIGTGVALAIGSAAAPSSPVVLAATFVLFALVALLGVQRGRRARFTRYFAYLIQFVPAGERLEFANSAYKEVLALVSAGPREDARAVAFAAPKALAEDEAS